MFNKDEIKKLQEKVDELSEDIKNLSKRQDLQYGEIMKQFNKDDERSDSDLYEEVLDVIQDTMKASTSIIQHSLGVGYSKAAKLLNLLEEKGIVEKAEGNKPRKVIVKEEKD